MTVHIQSLEGQQISKLVSYATNFLLSPKDADILEFCQAMSMESWTGYVDDKLVCCWGLIPPTILSNQAYLWMHSTQPSVSIGSSLVRHSQRVIEEALTHYERIIGHCRTEAEDSMRWLAWLGAEFAPSDGEYSPFLIRRKLHG